jgi:hypothetical protein
MIWVNYKNIIIFSFLVLIAVTACKPKQRIIYSTKPVEDKENNQLFSDINTNTFDFNTFSSRLNMSLTSGTRSVSSRANLRIIKDSAILISVQPLFGVEVVRLYIDPNNILILDRMNKRYVKESLISLKEKYPVGFDFYTLQSILTNSPFVSGKSSVEDSDYRKFNIIQTSDLNYYLTSKDPESDIEYSFTVNGNDRITFTHLMQYKKQQSLQWAYDNFAILALILSNSDGGLEIGFLIRLLISLAVFSVIIFMVVPKIAKWFFKRADSEKYSNFIFVLFIVFASGFLVELGGIEPIIGAFAAGLALNRLIPHSSALMNRIEFFGNALFIPIFLISVGMLVDMSIVFDGLWTMIVAVTLTIVALAGKWVAAYATQKSFQYSSVQRNIIFGLSSSHAAATLAIILVGYRAEILDEYILNGTIILILITCLIATLVTQKAAKKIARSEEDAPLTPAAMGEFAQEKILVPIANPLNIGHHVELAMLLKDKKSVNSISLLGVMVNNEEVEKNIVNFRKQLQVYISTATAAEVDVDIITTIDHNPADGIARIAKETMTDLVILGWPGKAGIWDKLLGERIEQIVKNLDKNLFVCHLEQNLITHKRIVVLSPPLAEKEDGFSLWVKKITKLSTELSIPILLLGDPQTYKVISSHKKPGNIVFKQFTDWDNPMSCGNEIKENDLIVLISAHQGYISHIPVLESLPTRLENRFPNHNKIVVYPKRNIVEELLESYDFIFTP